MTAAVLTERRSAATTPDASARFPAAVSAAVTSVFGLPFRRWTMADTLDWIDESVALGRPRQLITANLHTCMVAAENVSLRLLAAQTTDVACVADGMPMVWASRRRGPDAALPERVAGSELIFRIAERAASQGHRVYLLGGAPDVLAATRERLTRQFPGLTVCGCESPPYRTLSQAEEADLCGRIRDARPDILLVAFGQPKGELWLARHGERLGVPVGIQLGASFDFVAGRVRRAPRWVQRVGMEWAFRLAMEPRRLCGRYWANARFLLSQWRRVRR